MRAQLEALVTQVQAFQAQTTAAVQTLTTSVEASVQTLATSVNASVQTLTTSVDASVAAVEGGVANLSTTVSGLSTTVSGLSTVATTGDFSDLTGRPSAVLAITVGTEKTATAYSGYQTLDLGAAAGKYCAISYDRCTLHP